MVKLKLSQPRPPTLQCSPLKRRHFFSKQRVQVPASSPGGGQRLALGRRVGTSGPRDQPDSSFSRAAAFPVFPMSFKNSGARKVINQYQELQSEAMRTRRRLVESKQKVRALKDLLKEQRTKSHQLIVSCAMKLQEKEREIESLKKLRQDELAAISRELVFLKGNMLKEQKRVAKELAAKDQALREKDAEIEQLRDKSKENACLVPQCEVETPESSPDSSPNRYAVPKFRIRPLREKNNRDVASPHQIPPPLPPPYQPGIRRPNRLRFPPARGMSADDAFICTPAVELGPKERDSGKDSESEEHYEVIDVLRDCSSSVSSGISSAGSTSKASLDSTPPDQAAESRGRHCYEELRDFNAFLCEEGLQEKFLISPSVALTNHKRFQKPSDVKHRSIMKSVMAADLNALEEHQVSHNRGVTTVTYASDHFF